MKVTESNRKRSTLKYPNLLRIALTSISMDVVHAFTNFLCQLWSDLISHVSSSIESFFGVIAGMSPKMLNDEDSRQRQPKHNNDEADGYKG